MTRYEVRFSVDGESISPPVSVGPSSVKVGRARANDLVLDLPWVSREQCVLRPAKDGIEIEIPSGERLLQTPRSLSHLGSVRPGETFTIKKLRGEVVLPPPSADRERIDRFEILGRLGKGGMGVVLLAHDPKNDRRVALKVLDARNWDRPEPLLRFQREGRLAGALEHPAIVGVYEVGQTDEVYFIVQELVEGEDLGRRLERGPFTPRQAARILLPIAHAVAYAHSRGVIHRDLKPSNIMLDAAGRAKLLDFGVARNVEETRMTSPGAGVGTPAYMAPEQMDGAATFSSDVYCLGAILYEMLTGVRAFPQNRKIALLRAILNEPPTPPTSVNPLVDAEIERICLTCLAKDAADRFPSATALAEALEAYLGGAAGIQSELGHADRSADSTILPALSGGGSDIPARPALPTDYCARCQSFEVDPQGRRCPSCGHPILDGHELFAGGRIVRLVVAGRTYLATPDDVEEARSFAGQELIDYLRSNRRLSAILADIHSGRTMSLPGAVSILEWAIRSSCAAIQIPERPEPPFLTSLLHDPRHR